MKTCEWLIFFAVEPEAKPFRALTRGHEGIEVRVTGMGRRAAEAAVRQALAELRPRLVLTCGFAGALSPELKLGDIVMEADPAFPMLLDGRGATHVRFHAATTVLTSVAEKAACWKATRADAVEMESLWIRAVCKEQGIPAATIRVISDEAGKDLPLNFNRLLGPDEQLSFPKLLGHVVTNPHRIPALIRFGRETGHAARQLATFLADLTQPVR